MKFISRIVVLFYVTVLLFFSISMLMTVFGFIPFRDATSTLFLVIADSDLRIIVGSLLTLIIVLTIIFYRIFLASLQTDRTIAFENPSGRVSVSLAALEDLIRRTLSRLTEIREAKSQISSTRKGLLVKVRLMLRAESNIPEITSRVQESIKTKIQDMIGMEEQIHVSIHVGKILSDRLKDRPKEKAAEPKDDQEPNIPFRGYRP